jgi:hypothetical protein
VFRDDVGARALLFQFFLPDPDNAPWIICELNHLGYTSRRDGLARSRVRRLVRDAARRTLPPRSRRPAQRYRLRSKAPERDHSLRYPADCRHEAAQVRLQAGQWRGPRSADVGLDAVRPERQHALPS